MKTINRLLNEIERHKGVFYPSRDVFIDWCFRYNCRLLECYGINPAQNPSELNKRIYNMVKKVYVATVKNYYYDTTLSKYYVSSVDSIDNILTEDIKTR